MREETLNENLARIVANTRRKKRLVSIPDLAGYIAAAADELGGLPILGERVILSPTMLRQFLAVRDLDPLVKERFESRELDSVDLCAQLATLSSKDQIFLAEKAAVGSIQTKDVRDFRELRHLDKDSPANELLEKILHSKPARQFIAEFVLRGGSIDEVRDRFANHVKPINIIQLSATGSIARLTLTEEGRNKLRDLSVASGVNLEQGIQMVAAGKI
jgi:hypothetical protein